MMQKEKISRKEETLAHERTHKISLYNLYLNMNCQQYKICEIIKNRQ